MRPIKCVLLVVAVAPMAVLGGQASAAPTFWGPLIYRGFADSPFNTGGFEYFYLETMEDGLLNTPGVTIPASQVGPPSSVTDSVDEDDGQIDGVGTAGYSLFSGFSWACFDITFSEAVLENLPTHVGIVWTDVAQVISGSYGYGIVTFEAFDSDGISLGTTGAAVGDGSIFGQTAEDRFFGVVYSGGISRVRVSMSNSNDWEIDHLQYGSAGPTGIGDPLTPAMPVGEPFPNPSRGDVNLLVPAGRAELEVRVFDIGGHLMRSVLHATGEGLVVRWDGRDEDGRRVPSGVYFLEVRQAGAIEARRKVVLVH